MLFLGLGTGLGSTLIADGVVQPMELGHLPYRKGTFEDYLGIRGLEKRGEEEVAGRGRGRRRPSGRGPSARLPWCSGEATSRS